MSDSTREVGKLRRELEAQRSQTERETETLISKHAEDLKGAGRQVEEKVGECVVSDREGNRDAD